MNDQTKPIDPRREEARTLAVLCAKANAARRIAMSIRMDDAAVQAVRVPRRLVAASH